jgi:sulfatase modifying factor 1
LPPTSNNAGLVAEDIHCITIPAGEFLMGSDAGQDDERPPHRVFVNAFEVGATQVRNRDYSRFLIATGHPPKPYGEDPNFNDPEQPVVAVSWFDAIAFCEWLSETSKHRYRLPTEAEWERAARGGCEACLYPWGDEPPSQYAEYQRRWGATVTGPLPVGGGTPNRFGLYDGCENVHEWCSDWYDPNYYSDSPLKNPQGPGDGTRRASKGGAWRQQIKVTRCSARSSIPPAFRYADYGFRVVRDLAR